MKITKYVRLVEFRENLPFPRIATVYNLFDEKQESLFLANLKSSLEACEFRYVEPYFCADDEKGNDSKDSESC